MSDPAVAALPAPVVPDAAAGLWRRTVISLVSVLALAAVCGVVLREPLTIAGTWFVDTLGAFGVALGVLVTDTSPLPLTNEPVLMLALGGGMSVWTVFAVAATTSWLAGIVGYSLGRLLDATTSAQARFRRWQPAAADWIERRGAVGVAIAALLPIPFSLATWSAGMMRVRLSHVAIASLARIPKTAFYLGLMAAGWSAGT